MLSPVSPHRQRHPAPTRGWIETDERRVRGRRTFDISAVVGPGRPDAVLTDPADLRHVRLGPSVTPVETVLRQSPLRTS